MRRQVLVSPEWGFGGRRSRRCAGKSGRINASRPGVQSSNYWSSTTNADNTDNAWNVNMNNGNVNTDNKTNTNHVWPVRAGE